MPLSFPGFPKAGIAFLRKLKKNNNRDWFQANKEIFDEEVKAPMTVLVEAYNSHLEKLAPLNVNLPAKAIYRIYRDTRFGKDKTPYKTHLGASTRTSAKTPCNFTGLRRRANANSSRD